jgi:hypothetical protein
MDCGDALTQFQHGGSLKIRPRHVVYMMDYVVFIVESNVDATCGYFFLKKNCFCVKKNVLFELRQLHIIWEKGTYYISGA